MSTATQRRPQTVAPSDGSRTITHRDAQPRQEDDGGGVRASSGGPSVAVGVLKLRGAQRRTRQHVAWGADVVDNEGCGKKKSKICCIYHKPRRFDESSSESESSASDSESGCYDGDRACPTGRYHQASHRHGYEHNHNTVQREGKDGTMHELRPDPDSNMNAYEKVPKRKN